MKKPLLIAIPAAILLITATAGIALWKLTPRWTPPPSLPNNPYLTLCDIGGQIPAPAGRGGPRRNRPDSPTPPATAAPTENPPPFEIAPLLPKIRAALDTPGIVPVEVGRAWLEKHNAETRNLLRLHVQLIAFAQRLETQGQHREALTVLLDAARLGAWSTRGGLLSDRLTGVKMESKALDEMLPFAPKLTDSDRTFLLAGVDALAQNWEPAAETVARERGWAWASGGFQERQVLLLERLLPNHPLRLVYDSARGTSEFLDSQRAKCRRELARPQPSPAPQSNPAPQPAPR